MSLNLIAPRIYLGGVADFGDATALQAAGVELAIMFGPGAHFPHAPTTLGAMVVSLSEDGQQPAWFVQGLATLLATAHGTKVLALCDAYNGRRQASYAVTCALAQKQGISYINARAIVQPLVTDWAVPDALNTQGRAIWP